MKSRVRIFFFVFFANVSLFDAQVSFSFNSGGSVLLGDKFAMPAVTLSPRLNIIDLQQKASISIGTHLSVGVHLDMLFDFDIPAVLEFNYGSCSNKNNSDLFGVFLGIGAAYNHFTNTYTATRTIGPLVNGGVLLGPYGLRFSAQQGTGPLFRKIYVIGFFYSI